MFAIIADGRKWPQAIPGGSVLTCTSAQVAKEEDMSDFQKRLDGFQLTTAEILYNLPDHPGILQSYIWQGLDMAPDYPVLCGFLDFWQRELDGPLHSVRIAICEKAGANQFLFAQKDITVH
jgi:uncharacterized protein Usg